MKVLHQRTISPKLAVYVIGEFLFSFLISFLFFFIIFFINQLIVVFRDVISRQVDTAKALLLLLFSLPAIAALAFPFGSLVATLLTIGRLSADNELIALQSLGFALKQVFLPIIITSLALTLFSFTINNIFLPLGTIQYRALMEKLLFSNTELILEPYSVTTFNQTSIITDDVQAGNLSAILLFDASERGKSRIIAAQGASLDKQFQNSGILKLNLDGVTMLEQGAVYDTVDKSSLDNLTYSLTIKDITRSIRNASPTEMSFVDIGKRIDVISRDLEAVSTEKKISSSVDKVLFNQVYFSAIFDNAVGTDQVFSLLETYRANKDQPVFDRNLQLHWVEFWKKLTIPVACTTLVILGFPLGLYARKSARGLGFGLGLLVAAIYWGSIIMGQVLAMDNLSYNATILMWLPNIFFLILGLIMFIPLVKR